MANPPFAWWWSHSRDPLQATALERPGKKWWILRGLEKNIQSSEAWYPNNRSWYGSKYVTHLTQLAWWNPQEILKKYHSLHLEGVVNGVLWKLGTPTLDGFRGFRGFLRCDNLPKFPNHPWRGYPPFYGKPHWWQLIIIVPSKIKIWRSSPCSNTPNRWPIMWETLAAMCSTTIIWGWCFNP